MGAGQRRAEPDALESPLAGEIQGPSTEAKLETVLPLDGLEVAPAHAVAPPGTNCLHSSFFSGKTKREVRSGAPPALAVTGLTLCKHALTQAVAAPGDRRFHASDLDDVDAGTDYHRAHSSIGGAGATGGENLANSLD
jgi:hypothetical protein